VRKIKSSLMFENILIDESVSGVPGNSSDNTASIKPHKSRAHRKKLADLAELGINGPFRASQRRDRIPFGEQDDQEILSGFEMYGPAWSRIQRDPRFHLQNRQATDLRDRFRNKYPERFRAATLALKIKKNNCKSTQQEVEPAPVLQPSASREGLKIHQVLGEKDNGPRKTLPGPSNLPSLSFKDPGLFLEPHIDTADSLPSFDWATNAPFPESIGEMDISRLLLDAPWMDDSRSKEKQTFTDINSILTSTSDELPPSSSYYGLEVTDKQISEPTSVPLDHDSSYE